jgi:hypothetical protein
MDFHHQSVTSAMKFQDFVKTLYPREPKYRVAAAHFIKEIAKGDGGLDGYELGQLCKNRNISRATMQKVFVRLRRLGLVDRRAMRYYLNNEFATALRRYGDSWRRLADSKAFDFSEEVLKID